MATGKSAKEDHRGTEKDHQHRHLRITYRFFVRIILFFLLSIIQFSPFQGRGQSLVSIKNETFSRGEKLTFIFYYDSYITGKVTAGTATLEVGTEPVQIEDRQTYHITGMGRTKGAFNLFFKVDDRFETYTDEEYLIPWRFIRHTREGSYKYDDEVKFNQFSGTALSTRANKNIPKGTHDVLSALFFARNLDLSNARPGDTFPLWFYLDDSLYVSQIQYTGREEVEIELGKFRCLRFKPMVATGNVFSQPYPMDLWVTDDKNHLPVLAKSAVIVGSIKMELIKYHGLTHPLTALISPLK